MSPRLEQLGLDQMSRVERLSLANELIDSVLVEEEEESHLLSAEQIAEIRRRVAAYEANPSDVVPWETVRAEAEARFQQ